MGKWSSKHQRNHCLEQHLRQGAKMTPKGAPKRKKSIFCAKNLFCAQNYFFYPKCKNERKTAKRVKMGFRIPKKALSRATFAPWAQNERLRSQKTQLFAQNALLRPKRVLGAFWRFGRKKSEKSILGDFWLQKRAQNLTFFTVWRSGRKR